MDPQTNDSTQYEVQYTDEAKGFLYRRRAATHVVFLVPYLQSGMCLLDCGCGPGSITADLANLGAAREVIGIDVDATQLELARAHADAAGVSNIRFEKGDVRQLHFDDESFDAVFTHGVIEYVSDPVATFAEIRRVLKPGGVLDLVMATGAVFCLHEIRQTRHDSLSYSSTSCAEVVENRSLVGISLPHYMPPASSALNRLRLTTVGHPIPSQQGLPLISLLHTA